jgi:hypothetical protein
MQPSRFLFKVIIGVSHQLINVHDDSQKLRSTEGQSERRIFGGNCKLCGQFVAVVVEKAIHFHVEMGDGGTDRVILIRVHLKWTCMCRSSRHRRDTNQLLEVNSPLLQRVSEQGAVLVVHVI